MGRKLDEVKLWDRALNDQEIENMESNESIGNNYDGTTRAPVTCNATVNANSWELVGIPIVRTDPKTVTETFQGMTGVYGADWRYIEGITVIAIIAAGILIWMTRITI